MQAFIHCPEDALSKPSREKNACIPSVPASTFFNRPRCRRLLLHPDRLLNLSLWEYADTLLWIASICSILLLKIKQVIDALTGDFGLADEFSIADAPDDMADVDACFEDDAVMVSTAKEK